MKGSCKNCNYWDQYEQDPNSGMCRRHAPRLIVACCGVGENPEYAQDWPTTCELDWCGEFQPG